MYIKFGYNQPSSFRGVEIEDGRRTEGGTDDGACLYYKLSQSLWLR